MASFNKDYNIGILGVKKPLDCSCQELLSTPNIVMNGWLRKRALRNKVISMSWPRMYVVVANQCMYYFSNETSRKAAGSVSLYGFNRICRAPRAKAGDAVWAFKLEHIQPNFHSLYFSAPSESEMVKWMRIIKHEMLTANGKSTSCSAGDSQYGESIASEDSWGSSDYNFLETSIYEEPCARPLSTIAMAGGSKDDSDFEDDCEKVTSVNRFHPRLTPSAPVYGTGYSVEKSVSPEPSTPHSDYWSAVRFDGTKLQASEIIDQLAQEGVYLVRKSEDNSNVLVVHAGQVKKYKVLDQANGKMTLSARTEPDFDTLEDMLYHYYSNNLPHSNQKLLRPFKLHEDYHKYT